MASKSRSQMRREAVQSGSWDAIAFDLGMPLDWRAEGYDTPEYMMQEDSVYRLMAKPGRLRCPFPDCPFTAKADDDGLVSMFRHAHNPKHVGRP